MALVKLSEKDQARVDGYLHAFAKEAEMIRAVIADDLPSYNQLISLHAKSFQELALKITAKKQNLNYEDVLFDYGSVIPECPECESPTKVYKLNSDNNMYLCKACRHKFTANKNSISSKSSKDALTWMKLLHCLLESYGVKRTCAYCNIEDDTYYNIRAKIFYAMRLMMDEVKLYGVVQCDNTFVHTNFKGEDLSDEDYPEDSPFDVINFKPRPARKRGGGYSPKNKNLNSICIYTAIDDHGHTVVRYVGIGNATATKLLKAVPSDKYILEVPKEDPFSLTFKNPEQKEINRTKSLLVSDKEKAITNYANKINIAHESHVFRRGGKQVVLPKGAHDIQRVNSLHKRLKDFVVKKNNKSVWKKFDE